jgi:hypothetical protein
MKGKIFTGPAGLAIVAAAAIITISTVNANTPKLSGHITKNLEAPARYGIGSGIDRVNDVRPFEDFRSCEEYGGVNRERNEGYTYTIVMDDATTDRPVDFSDLYDELQVIPLETKKESLLQSIDKLIATNNSLYVLDDRTPAVLEFDMNGKFVRRFGNKGSGPGEYLMPKDITIDEERRNLWILDYMQQRLFCYDLDTGVFQKDLRFPGGGRLESCDAVTIVGNSFWASKNYRSPDSPQYMLKSYALDNLETETSAHLDRNDYLQGFDSYTTVGINKFLYAPGREYAIFSNIYINQIFKINSGSVEKYVYIDSKDILNEADRQAISQAARDRTFTTPSKYRNISEYFETDRYICFKITIGMSIKGVVFYKDSNDTVVVNSMAHDLLFKEMRPEFGMYTPLSYADGEWCYYYVRPEDIVKLKFAARDGWISDGIDNIETLKYLDEEANPVILRYKFKD